MRLVFAIVAGIALVFAATPARAVSDCVSKQPCPEGQTPPNCCEPPTCQIFEILELVRAQQRMVSGGRPAKALQNSHGNDSVAASLLKHSIGEEGRAVRAASKCGPATKRFAVPATRITPSCRLEWQEGSEWSVVASPESLAEQFDMCSEVSEAAFSMASHLARLCSPGETLDVHYWAARYSDALQEFIDTLRSHLESYWVSCSSPYIDDKTRRQLEEADLTMEDPKPHVEAALEALRRVRGTR